MQFLQKYTINFFLLSLNFSLKLKSHILEKLHI